MARCVYSTCLIKKAFLTCSFAIELEKNKSPFKKYLNCEGTKNNRRFFHGKEGKHDAPGSDETKFEKHRELINRADTVIKFVTKH